LGVGGYILLYNLKVNAQTNAKYIEQINIKNDEIQKLIEE